MSANRDTAPMVKIAAYTLLNFVKHSFWSFFGLFGLVYLTDVVGLDPAFAGSILLASLVFDGLIDPLVGAAIDWLRSKLPDYGWILLGGVLASAVSLALFFNTAALDLGIVWLLVLLLVFRLTFTVFDLSDNALASRITASVEERTAMAAWRKAAAALASLATGAAVGYIASDAAEAAVRLPVFALILAVASLLLAWLGYTALKRLDQAGPPIKLVEAGEWLIALGGAQGALVLAFLALIETTATPVLVGGLIYFSRALTGDAHWAGTAIVILTLAQLALLPLWAWAAVRLGKRATLALTHAATALACLAFAFLAATSAVWGWLLVGVVGAMVGGVSTLRWSLVPDLIDAASRDGPRLETSLVGLVSGAVQIGSGLAVAMLGVLLGLAGYSAQAPADVDVSLLAGGIGLFVGSAHGICAVLSWLWARSVRAAEAA
ncbi:MAG: hypothetical protein B7Y36_12615 [Novosphingobium sp. 28-62-57]|nr:MFS transporter [Novosphingobium sp. 28-62-57]OYW49174.1 MAG: hypothetical protein B7Z34_10315 [Novosphingobium sp. 12-62-10]OYZ09797.1 MAG: hypothetical protein B7Y36_12615 [Novosphingobium sp. 28-62-57]OZA36520.1 MAG: hypothetical protein B7X92_06140 [Novosphingobium sp. 17-62-9]